MIVDADEILFRESILKGFQAHKRQDWSRAVVQMYFHIVLKAFDVGDSVQIDLLESVFGLYEDAFDFSLPGHFDRLSDLKYSLALTAAERKSS